MAHAPFWPKLGDPAPFYPAAKGPHTALIMCRIVRLGTTGNPQLDWTIQMIDGFDHTARDFGTLLPEMKLYMADLVPGLTSRPQDRVALMRKGGRVRLSDYCETFPPPVVARAIGGARADDTA